MRNHALFFFLFFFSYLESKTWIITCYTCNNHDELMLISLLDYRTFGPNKKVNLQLLDVTAALDAMRVRVCFIVFAQMNNKI